MWYFEIVSNFTHLTAREITYNNFEISLRYLNYAKYQHKSCYYLYESHVFEIISRSHVIDHAFRPCSCKQLQKLQICTDLSSSWSHVTTLSLVEHSDCWAYLYHVFPKKSKLLKLLLSFLDFINSVVICGWNKLTSSITTQNIINHNNWSIMQRRIHSFNHSMDSIEWMNEKKGRKKERTKERKQWSNLSLLRLE